MFELILENHGTQHVGSAYLVNKERTEKVKLFHTASPWQMYYGDCLDTPTRSSGIYPLSDSELAAIIDKTKWVEPVSGTVMCQTLVENGIPTNMHDGQHRQNERWLESQ